MIIAFAAAAHYLALGLGLGSVYARGVALRTLATIDPELRKLNLRTLFLADNFWGVAALLWIGTGLARAFGGLEKGTDFYLSSNLFWVKMALFLGVFALEVVPMITFIQWRIANKKQTDLERLKDNAFVQKLRLLNSVQVALIIAIPFVASLMSRGF